MTSMNDSEQGWVSSACTLPSAKQPLRVAEFDRFFAQSIRSVARASATRLDVVIARTAEKMGRDLAQRETECCSFFRFDFQRAGEDVLMRISVPQKHMKVLDALQARVDSIATGRDGEIP